MITEEEERLEKSANLQIKAMRKVLNSLLELSGVSELPNEYYWFRYVDYAVVDRYGDPETWSRGYRGDPDSRTHYDLVVDEQLLADLDVEAFEIRFRAKNLPIFNEARNAKRENLAYSIKVSQEKLASLQGDIV